MAKEFPVSYALILVAVIIVVGILAGIAYLVPNPSGGKTISVTGTADMKVAPDQSVIYLQVVTQNDSADVAKNMNANISDAVLKSLSNVGVDNSEIETSGYSVSPVYNYTENGGQTLEGYSATNSMTVTLTDFNSTGKVVDAAVNAGALVSNIDYELSLAKQNEYKAYVLANASLDAKTKAQAIVSGLGRSLGDLVSVSTSDYNYMPYPVYSAAAAVPGVNVKQVATNLPPSNVDVTGTVEVIYNVN